MRTCVTKIMLHFTWVYLFHSRLFLWNVFSLRINPSWVGVCNNEIFSCVFVRTIESLFIVRCLRFTFHCFWVKLTWLCASFVISYIFYVHYIDGAKRIFYYSLILIRMIGHLSHIVTLYVKRFDWKWYKMDSRAWRRRSIERLIVDKSICTINFDCIRPILETMHISIGIWWYYQSFPTVTGRQRLLCDAW